MKQKEEQKGEMQKGFRWLRVGLFTLSAATPIINAAAKRMQKRSEALQAQAQEKASDLRHTLEQQTRQQRRDLRKTVKELRNTGTDWGGNLKVQSGKVSRDLIERGGKVTSDLADRGGAMTQELVKRGAEVGQNIIERGGKVTSDLAERGGVMTQELVKRGAEVGQDIIERGGKVSRDLQKRGKKVSRDLQKRGKKVSRDLQKRGEKVSRDLRKRGENLFQPARKRVNIWAIIGFSVGLATAAIGTFLYVRGRVAQAEKVSDEHIELPPQQTSPSPTTPMSQPAGEIHHVNSDGPSKAKTKANTKATATAVAVDAPPDAVFAGVVSTKRYYPLDAAPKAEELVYFVSAEEAEIAGYTAGE